MKSSNNNAGIIGKFPVKMLVFYILLFLTPFLASIGWLVEMKIYGADVVRVLTHPLFIIPIAIYILVIIFNYAYHTKKLYAYDGSPETDRKVNKTAKMFENMSLGLGARRP